VVGLRFSRDGVDLQWDGCDQDDSLAANLRSRVPIPFLLPKNIANDLNMPDAAPVVASSWQHEKVRSFTGRFRYASVSQRR